MARPGPGGRLPTAHNKGRGRRPPGGHRHPGPAPPGPPLQYTGLWSHDYGAAPSPNDLSTATTVSGDNVTL